MKKTVLGLILLSFALSGCGILGPKKDNLSEQNNTIVALDFVNALSNLRGHNPKNTMVQIRPPKTEFGTSLKRELRNAGYGIQGIAKNDTGPMLVTYQADSFENSTFKSVAYRMRVGGVELGREYEIRAGRIFPITSLSVKGVEIASKPLDQSIFERGGTEEQLGTGGPWTPILPGNAIQPYGSTPQQETIVQAVPMPQPINQIEIVASSTTPPDRTNLRPKQNTNMLMLGESNYAHIFKNYTVVEQDVIIFPNDSLNLGSKGKQQIKEVISRFDSDRDLISVVGCSHGKSRIADGNEMLALGRANRVMDELLSYKAPADRLYDEGCWAGVEQKNLPARGVIISLRRQNKPS